MLCPAMMLGGTSLFQQRALYPNQRLLLLTYERCSERPVSGFQFMPWPILSARRKNQFLHAPIQQLGDIQLILRRTRHLVYPPKLLQLLA